MQFASDAEWEPVEDLARHAPEHPGIDRWLTDCMNLVNSLGGIARPDEGIHVGLLTKYESEFQVISGSVV